MIRPIIALTLGALSILLCATFWLFLLSPGHAKECNGEMMVASWYGSESGNRTANGEAFNGSSLTAAHRSLPFGTKLSITYNGKSVVVRVNDRGPYSKGRSLDLSRAAAAKIDMIDAGVAKVCVKAVKG